MTTSSVPSRIPSPSSISSSLISPASEQWSPTQYFFSREAYRGHPPPLSPEEPLKPRPSYRKHSRYYLADGNVVFLVDGMLYNVHRYFFQRDSSNFAAMFTSLPHGGCGKGLTDDEPIQLPRVAAEDFDLFLSILYPSDFGVYVASTVADWTAILNLAANWNFTSIKTLAIKNLAPIASPIDKIVLGRKHGIEEWLGDAYESICRRDDPLTLDDGLRLGMEDVIKISATRQRIQRQPSSPSDQLFNIIRETFGLEPYVQGVSVPVGQGEGSTVVGEVNPLNYQPPPVPLTAAANKEKPLTKGQMKKKQKLQAEAVAKAEKERIQKDMEECRRLGPVDLLAALDLAK